MNLLLTVAWFICIVWSIVTANEGGTPSWDMVILPCICLALDNLFDWISLKIDKDMEKEDLM